MNDEMTFSMVSTLRGYVDRNMQEKKDTHTVRLDWDALP